MSNTSTLSLWRESDKTKKKREVVSSVIRLGRKEEQNDEQMDKEGK